jgi:hypothetical protein
MTYLIRGLFILQPCVRDALELSDFALVVHGHLSNAQEALEVTHDVELVVTRAESGELEPILGQEEVYVRDRLAIHEDAQVSLRRARCPLALPTTDGGGFSPPVPPGPLHAGSTHGSRYPHPVPLPEGEGL